jgi:hypothetical protein
VIAARHLQGESAFTPHEAYACILRVFLIWIWRLFYSGIFVNTIVLTDFPQGSAQDHCVAEEGGQGSLFWENAEKGE